MAETPNSSYLDHLPKVFSMNYMSPLSVRKPTVSAKWTLGWSSTQNPTRFKT